MQREHGLFFGLRLFKEPVLVSVGTCPNAVRNPSSAQVSMENHVESELSLCRRSQVCLFRKENIAEFPKYSMLLLLKSGFASAQEKKHFKYAFKEGNCCVPFPYRRCFPGAGGEGTGGSQGQPGSGPGILRGEEEEMLCG